MAMRRLLGAAGGLLLAFSCRLAHAERGPTTPTLIPDAVSKAPSIDGLLTEWTLSATTLAPFKGAPRGADLSATARLAFDDKHLYLAVDVTDDVYRSGLDHVDLVVGTPDRRVTTISLFPGEVGQPARAMKDDKKVDGAKVVEAPKKGGYTLEARLPWNVLPSFRVGLRGAVVVHDADGSEVDAAVSSAKKLSYADLPGLPMPLELGALKNVFKTASGGVSIDMVGNVAGDASPERIMFDDQQALLVVLGTGIRNGKEFYVGDFKKQGVKVEIMRVELRDFDGDGRKDIYFERRTTEKKVSRWVAHIQSFKTDTPDTLFQHEIGIETPEGSLKNKVVFTSEKGKLVISITPGEAKKLDSNNYNEPVETSFDPLLTPWGSIREQVYALQGGSYVRTSEKRSEASPSPPAAGPDKPGKPIEGRAPTQPPSAPPPLPSSDKVYELYKKDQKATGKARVDVTADVDGDDRTERVIVHDRDIVVMGPGFKAGTGYSFATLPFAQASDIKSVGLKDVTGDKKAELLIRGVLRGKATKEAGGGDVEREVEVVYRVSGETVSRVFGAEIARTMGERSVSGRIAYKDKGWSIVLGPGKAVGFTKANYPFQQDTGPVGGMEPLLLPWSGSDIVTYKWSGSAFVKQ